MLKRVILAIVAAFVAFTVLSMLMHGVILSKSYGTPVFRPETEMSIGLALAVNLVVVWAFVLVYARYVQPKSVLAGLGMGTLWGIASGVSMGMGSFSAMAIEFNIALTWCLGTLVQFVAVGLIAGLIVKQPAAEAAAA